LTVTPRPEAFLRQEEEMADDIRVQTASDAEASPAKHEATAIARSQLVLAEKRTSLAVMRTGIGVLTLPLSVATVLIATRRNYSFLDTYHLLIPLMVLCLGLIALGTYLVHRSVLRIWKHYAMLKKIKREDPNLARLYEGQI
jgi:hypothetical protein